MSRHFRRNPRIEFAPLSEEAILFDPQTSKFFVLNETSAFLWDFLSKGCTAEYLAGEIWKSFDQVELADALRDVEKTLPEMLSLELVVAADHPQT